MTSDSTLIREKGTNLVLSRKIWVNLVFMSFKNYKLFRDIITLAN